MSEEPSNLPDAEEPEEPEESGASEEKKKLPMEFWVGRVIVASILGIVGLSFSIAMFASLYRAVTAQPKIWIKKTKGKRNAKGYWMKPLRIRTCVKRLKIMDKEMEHELLALWFRVRKGNARYLTAWTDWSRDWRRRMGLLQRQCPLKGSQTLTRAFQRASTRLLLLQKRQEKSFADFYKKNLWLFKEIRQGLHKLQEELR